MVALICPTFNIYFFLLLSSGFDKYRNNHSLKPRGGPSVQTGWSISMVGQKQFKLILNSMKERHTSNWIRQKVGGTQNNSSFFDHIGSIWTLQIKTMARTVNYKGCTRINLWFVSIKNKHHWMKRSRAATKKIQVQTNVQTKCRSMEWQVSLFIHLKTYRQRW